MSKQCNIDKKVLEQKYLYEDLTHEQLAIFFNVHPSTIFKKLIEFKIKLRGVRKNKPPESNPKFIDLTGQKFGELETLEYLEKDRKWKVRCSCGTILKVPSAWLRNKGIVKCEFHEVKKIVGLKFGLITCLNDFKLIKTKENINRMYIKGICDCGTEKWFMVKALKSGNTKSCGCFKKDKKNNNKWNGYEEIPHRYFTSLKSGAIRGKNKDRILPFDITIEYIWDLFIKQNRKCALSGVELKFGTCSLCYDQTASLDRIDSSKGYIEGNVQWVDKDLNKLKMDLSDERFIEICNLVSNYQKSKIQIEREAK